jgi:dTDP-4-dehydrorhamnose 3,5-epimerase
MMPLVQQSGNFTFETTPVEGLVVVTPRVFDDERGYFMETYQAFHFAEGGITASFVQDNQSASVKGVLRGLHFQIEHPQAKLVRVIRGEVFDVAVDVRPNSATFGQWFGIVLSEENKKQLFIPRGFAHGFLVLSDYAEFAYKCDDVYYPGDEGGIAWNDDTLNINWPELINEETGEPIPYLLSDKDQTHPTFPEVFLNSTVIF